MAIADEYTRAERRTRLALRIVLGLMVAVVAAGLVVRFRPDAVPDLFPMVSGLVSAHDSSPDTLALAAASAPPAGTSRQVPVQGKDTTQQDTTQRPLPAVGALAPADTAHPAPRRRRRRPVIITDVVLLPCSLANPTAEGGFILPPHNPRHRTIVGLPSGPGEPRRGFVIPPHDPRQENQVSITVVPMDSILNKTLLVPRHDPAKMNVVRPPALPCRPDSAGGA